MQLHFSTRYDKEYNKLPPKIKQQADDRIRLFASNQFHPLLNSHSLGGKYEGCRSINITGDYRAIFYIQNDLCVFIRIGTHPQLYG